MKMLITDFPRLGYVLGEHNYYDETNPELWGSNPGIAMGRWLTLDNFSLDDPFLFTQEEYVDHFDGSHHYMQLNYTTGVDYLIRHFINRRIGVANPDVFRAMFSQRFRQVKATYTLAYKAWNSYYELGVNPTSIDAPLFSTYYALHTEEFTTTGTKNTDEQVSGTATIANALNTTTVNGGTIGDTSTSNTDVESTDTVTTSDHVVQLTDVTVANTETATTTDEQVTKTTTDNGGTNVTTTTNDGTETTSVNQTATNSVDGDIVNTTRTLISDTPQSNVSASTTGDPASITWTYASNLEDNIAKTANNATTTDTTTGTTTNTLDTTNIASNVIDTTSVVDGTLDNTSTLDKSDNTVTDGSVDTTTTGTTTDVLTTSNDNVSSATRTLATTTDVVGADTTNQTNTSETTAMATLSDAGTTTTTDVQYQGLQSPIEAFLGSPFSNYFWDKLYSEFEDLFLGIHDLDNKPLYTWQVTESVLGVLD